MINLTLLLLHFEVFACTDQVRESGLTCTHHFLLNREDTTCMNSPQDTVKLNRHKGDENNKKIK